MDTLYSLRFILLFGLFIGGSICENDDPKVLITSETEDLSLILGQNKTVTFKVENSSLLEEPVTINFVQNPHKKVKLVPSSVTIEGKDFEEFDIDICATDAGITTVTLNSSSPDLNIKHAFVRVTIQHSETLDIFSQVIGWIYFVAWSISFYPQIYENWKRKSVVGLSFDFLSLNVVGFTLYSLFNVGLYWIPQIQAEYFSRHQTGVNPVQLNDVIFSLHAVFACIVTIFQCAIYERGTQKVSKICKGILIGITLFLVISFFIVLGHFMEYLDFLYFCSYVKLFITLIKYIPQAYLNFRRKSTFGWSIGNILLDFTGGILSIGQMFVIAYNENDWSSIFGDPTKFGLGLFSVMFDILFILQHYVFYRNNHPSEELVNDDVIEDQNHSDDEARN